mmetsp:Transcript_633/g.998  ORF Transcript_633/g.998 Transcript_633/m.998 type:complete len:140 (+) Transcript_633:71-490(+)
MRVEVACALSLASVVLTGCGKSDSPSPSPSPSGSCDVPSFPSTAQCITADLEKIGAEKCTLTTDVTNCVKACGVPGSADCIQKCYTKQCPDVNAKCLSCYSKLTACAECAARTGKDVKSACNDPYDTCVGIPEPSQVSV